MNKRTQTGFSLYELMITVAIVGVILAIGVPNMRQFTENSRMSSTANDLHAAFHLARSESTRAKTNITICASANSEAADADCGGTWDQGYIVFVDTNGDIARAGGTETVLRAQPAAATGVSFVVADNAGYFSFASTGLGRENVGGNPAVSQVVICDERGNIEGPGDDSVARLFVATPLGRATIVRQKTMVDGALTAIGDTCP